MEEFQHHYLFEKGKLIITRAEKPCAKICKVMKEIKENALEMIREAESEGDTINTTHARVRCPHAKKQAACNTTFINKDLVSLPPCFTKKVK